MENTKTITGRGGAGRGQGRKKGKTKTSIQVTLDDDIIKFLDNLGGKKATQINKILRGHMTHIEQLIIEADTNNERF